MSPSGTSQVPNPTSQDPMRARRLGAKRWKSGVGLIGLALLVVSAMPAFAQEERITEIRVHGNHTTPDADIVALSGLTAGGPANPERLRDAERALRETGRFEAVEIRRRYLSIADASQILLMIVVDEHPAVSALDLTPGPMKKLGAASMWLPIVHIRTDTG